MSRITRKEAIMNISLYHIGQLIVAWMRPRNRVARVARWISDSTAGTDGRREASHAPDQIIIHLSM